MILLIFLLESSKNVLDGPGFLDDKQIFLWNLGLRKLLKSPPAPSPGSTPGCQREHVCDARALYAAPRRATYATVPAAPPPRDVIRAAVRYQLDSSKQILDI